MRYGSVCSGIEKSCSKCGETKPLDQFHKQKTGPFGRHSWCRKCANENQRRVRVRLDTTENRRTRLLKQRYSLTVEDVAGMLAGQGGVCAICQEVPTKACVDHDHATGKVRGILCHGCNIKLGPVEDAAFRSSALAYLRRFS